MKASRIILVTIVVLLLAVLGGSYRYARSVTPQLELGVGYAAKVACGCRYMGNRPLDQCYADFEPGMEMIHLSDDPASRTITASVPLIGHRSARYDPVLGCQAERFVSTPLKLR